MKSIDFGRALVAFFAIGIALNACLYFLQNADEFSFTGQRSVYAEIYPLLYAHIFGGVVALIAGAVQFFPATRRRFTRHRLIGRIYLGGIVIGASAGLVVAFYAFGGVSNSVAFWLLSTLWLYTTAQAFVQIRRGNVTAHRVWMVRSYALTFAAVTLRAELGLFIGVFGLSFAEAYLIVPWSCWVLNLVVTEWFIVPRVVAHTQTHRPLESLKDRDTQVAA